MSSKSKKDVSSSTSAQSKSGSKKKKGDGSASANEAKAGLPFEPVSTKVKTPKRAPVVAQSSSPRSNVRSANSIPQVVSQRMARRMAFFCGIPSFLGMMTFVVSYVVVTQGWYKLPNSAVLLVSLGFFGLGVVGLTYGNLSASWDEDRVGSLLGFSEFKINAGRVAESWKAARELAKQEKS